MLYILYGPDDYSIAQELEAVKRTAGDLSALSTNTVVLAGSEITVNDFRVACETVPFLADKRLVIIYGLLERFMPKQLPRTGTRRREAPLINYEVLGDIINNIPASTLLVLIENELKDSNPLFKIITRKAQTKAFPMLKAPQLREWIIKRITEEGSSISPSAITMLTRLIGSNLWFMSSELKKLALYTDGHRIEEKDVKALVSYTQQSNVFAMVDAIVEFDIHKAETMLQQLLSEGGSPTQLLNMLSRQMRLIVRAKELKQQKVSETEMRGRLGLTADWLVRKTMEQASHYTYPRLRQVYQQLLDTDIAIKTGKYEGELALNILIAELCQNSRYDTLPQQIQGVAV